MKIFNIGDSFTIFRGDKTAEPKFRSLVSEQIITKFGKPAYSI